MMPKESSELPDSQANGQAKLIHSDTKEQSSSTRRQILGVGACTLGVGVIGGIIAPAIRYLTFPVEVDPVSGSSGFFPIGERSRFSQSDPTKIDIITDRKDAWSAELQVKVGSAWVMQKNGKLFALSSICPHLGCFVDYDGASKKFKCPCHRSAFGLDGSREEGPSPRSLDQLEIREIDDQVELQFLRFKLGQEAKEPMG